MSTLHTDRMYHTCPATPATGPLQPVVQSRPVVSSSFSLFQPVSARGVNRRRARFTPRGT
jgi:hypothetical protein